MPSEESGVNTKQESESTTTASPISQAAPVAPSLSTRPFTPLAPPPSANANERAGLSESHSLINSRSLIITDGQFHQTHGHHNSLVIHVSQGSTADSQSSSPPSNEIRHISPTQVSGQSTSHSENRTRIEVDHERNQSQVSSQSQEISFQKSNDIYERHLILKGRGFPLWIPDPNRVLHLDYRRTGVRIGDVGIITESGAFSFLFNICLPHDDPVNPRMLPEHFTPISPPIEATDIENFRVFKNGDHLASASVRRSQTGTAISDIVFESSASEGAILTMPRGARSEKLGNLARFREYEAANIANWYRFVNGPRGREAKNGDVRLVVGFDKTTSWGIATFANQTQQNSSRFKFGPSEGDSTRTYTWSEYSGVADVRAGPDSDEIDELRIDGDPPDVQFENQCLFVRTLNVTLADDVWADIHSTSGSNPVDPRNSQYPRVKNYSDSNRPHSNDPDNGSNFPPSQGAQCGTQRRLQGVDNTSDENPPIFVSGPVESITAHPSKVLNDTLLAKIPNAKMVITHDDDWSSVTEYDTLPDPHEFVANILASRDIYQENGVVFLEPKKVINEISEDSTSVDRAQALLKLRAPRFSPPQTGGTVTNLDSINVENTNIKDINSLNYYQGGAPPDNRRQHIGPKALSGPDQKPDDKDLEKRLTALSSSSRNVEGSDSMNTGKANLSNPSKPVSTSPFNSSLSSSGGKRSETETDKKQVFRKIVLELASKPGNNVCADCKARLPRWASHNLGIFICVNCATIHRKIGTHITKVKSLTLDDWTKEQVETMKSIGNINSNNHYNPNGIHNPPPERPERGSEIEQYIRAKYEYRKFIDKSALVASKLVDSRSASLARLPQPVPLPRSSAHATKPHVAASTASTSLPPKPLGMLSMAQPSQHSGGVWDDMVSLMGNNSQNSSLPLQYQQPTYSQGSHSMQLPAVNSSIGANNNYFVGAPTSGIDFNPYQPDQFRTIPFSRGQSRPSSPPSSIMSTFSTTQAMSSQPFVQQSFGVSQSSAPLPVTPTYYNPEPQFPLQSHYSIQQYISDSPQLMQSSYPQFVYQNPGPAQSQIGSYNVSGQSQALGMTTMGMQQQHRLQQLGQNYYSSMQPQMMSRQVNDSETSLYPQGGFPPQTDGGGRGNPGT